MPNPFSANTPDSTAWSAAANTPTSQPILTPSESIATPAASAYTPAAETPASEQTTQWLPSSSWDYYLFVHYDPHLPPQPQYLELARKYISMGDIGRKEYIYKFLESVVVFKPHITPRPPILRLDLDARVQNIPMGDIQTREERGVKGFPWVCVRTSEGQVDERLGRILGGVDLEYYDGGGGVEDIIRRVPQLWERRPLLYRDIKTGGWGYREYEVGEEDDEQEDVDDGDGEDEDGGEVRRGRQARVTLLLLDEVSQRTGWVRVVRLCCRGEVCFDERIRCWDLGWVRMMIEYGGGSGKGFDELMGDLVESNGKGEGGLVCEGWGMPAWCDDGEREMLMMIARGQMEGQ